MTQPLPDAILKAVQQTKSAPISEDRLLKVRDAVRQARDLERQKADQEAALSETNKELQRLYYETLPDIFDEAEVPKLTIAAEGNYPEVEAKREPYYHAVISADWDEARRNAAFEYLDEIGHGGLIKTVVEVQLPRMKDTTDDTNRENLETLKRVADEMDLVLLIKEAVPWNTLTAWLKDQVENKHQTPDLDKIGGTMGRVVKLKTKDKGKS